MCGLFYFVAHFALLIFILDVNLLSYYIFTTINILPHYDCSRENERECDQRENHISQLSQTEIEFDYFSVSSLMSSQYCFPFHGRYITLNANVSNNLILNKINYKKKTKKLSMITNNIDVGWWTISERKVLKNKKFHRIIKYPLKHTNNLISDLNMYFHTYFGYILGIYWSVLDSHKFWWSDNPRNEKF